MKKEYRPIILVTTTTTMVNSAIGTRKNKAYMGFELYLKWITDYGGIPILLPNNARIRDLPHILKKIDGILLTGGPDLSPKLYDETQLITYSNNHNETKKQNSLLLMPSVMHPDLHRDKLELQICKLAKTSRTPIFGICRGMQVLNICEHGTLIQHLPSDNLSIHYARNTTNDISVHDVEIKKETIFYDLWKCRNYPTSSYHHQAIKKLGKNFIASGVSSDGIIEFIENTKQGQFIIGIQGHPEKTRKSLEKYELLMHAFIDKATTYKQAQLKL